ncbi:MAG: hypothetical protein SNJ83_14620, partial [Aggregatilineales bacterium]
PVVSLIWDPLEQQVQYGKLDFIRWAHYSIHSYFYNILRLSKYCIVMSDEMGTAYQPYTNPVTIRSGIPDEFLPSRKTSRKTRVERDYYQVGFAGSLYGVDSFRAFIKALDAEKWVVNEHPVQFVAIGTSVLPVHMRAPKPAEIIWLGRHSQLETISILSECDVLYLPYPMDAKHKKTVTTSFPTKMSTYVAANVPIFYHGPSESTVASFIKKHPVALLCSTLDTTDILKVMTELLTNVELRDSIKVTQCQVFDEHFSFHQFKSKIISTLELAIS